MSKPFVSIDATSTKTSISLFDEKKLLGTVGSDDLRASSHLILYLSSLLQEHKLTLADLSFIAINKGPGAFTSLRVAIATVNGIAFGLRKPRRPGEGRDPGMVMPLIGVDGLDGLCMHIATSLTPDQLATKPLLVGLLNAYNNDVYYALEALPNDIENDPSIRPSGYSGRAGQDTQFPAHGECFLREQKMYRTTLTVHEKGCKKIDEVLPLLAKYGTKQPFVIAGNAVPLHRPLLDTCLADCNVTVMEFETATAPIIGRMAFEQFERHEGMVEQIEPLYLKSQYFAVRNPPIKPNTSK